MRGAFDQDVIAFINKSAEGALWLKLAGGGTSMCRNQADHNGRRVDEPKR